jgi:hypothetical protein
MEKRGLYDAQRLPYQRCRKRRAKKWESFLTLRKRPFSPRRSPRFSRSRSRPQRLFAIFSVGLGSTAEAKLLWVYRSTELSRQEGTGSRMRVLRAWLSYLLCIQTAMPAALAQNAPAQIKIVVVEGEGAINNVGQRSTRNPVIRVQDENDKPIAGAVVVFSLPTEGASGFFSNGDKTLIVTTDARGEGAASGLRVNEIPGRLQVHVNASYRGQTARVNITQFSMAVPGKRAGAGGGGGSRTALVVLALVGTAAAGGAAFALRNKNGAGPLAPPTAPGPTPIGIAPGAGTVGPPR